MAVFGRDMLGTDQEAQLTAAHELAHQWFGDSVGIERWSDIWLNEAFANYLQYVWMAHADPTFDLDRTMANLRAEQADELGPILDPGATGTFSSSIYERGALAVHALRRTIGDAAFFTLLHRWTVEHRYGTATTAEFIALAEQVAGRPLDDFFHAWLRGEDGAAPPRHHDGRGPLTPRFLVDSKAQSPGNRGENERGGRGWAQARRASGRGRECTTARSWVARVSVT